MSNGTLPHPSYLGHVNLVGEDPELGHVVAAITREKEDSTQKHLYLLLTKHVRYFLIFN